MEFLNPCARSMEFNPCVGSMRQPTFEFEPEPLIMHRQSSHHPSTIARMDAVPSQVRA